METLVLFDQVSLDQCQSVNSSSILQSSSPLSTDSIQQQPVQNTATPPFDITKKRYFYESDRFI